jgi:hypothetical protein
VKTIGHLLRLRRTVPSALGFILYFMPVYPGAV